MFFDRDGDYNLTGKLTLKTFNAYKQLEHFIFPFLEQNCGTFFQWTYSNTHALLSLKKAFQNPLLEEYEINETDDCWHL